MKNKKISFQGIKTGKIPVKKKLEKFRFEE